MAGDQSTKCAVRSSATTPDAVRWGPYRTREDSHDPHPKRVAGVLDARRRRHRRSPDHAAGCRGHPVAPGNTVRFATFNASLNRATAGQLQEHLATPGNAQASAVAEIIQRVRP